MKDKEKKKDGDWMKNVHIVAVSPSSSAKFGIGVAFLDFVELLSPHFSITVITRSNFISDKLREKAEENKHIKDSVEVIKTSGVVSDLFSTLEVFRRNSDKTIFAVGFVRWAIPILFFAKVLTGVAKKKQRHGKICIVFYSHSPIVRKGKGVISNLRDMLAKFTLELTCEVITVSDFMRERIKEFFGVPSHVIPNIVELPSRVENLSEKGRGNRETHPIQLPLFPEKMKLAFFGNPIPRKHPEIFFELVRILGDEFDYVFVGGDKEDFKLPDEVKRRVKFFGFVPRDGAIELMDSADIVVAPYEDEPFGLVVAEAMALRKIVVGLRSGALPELIKDGETGFLVGELSPHKFAEVIKRARHRKDVGWKAEKFIRKNFSRDVVRKKWIGFLSDMYLKL